jgi:hypothetical protein
VTPPCPKRRVEPAHALGLGQYLDPTRGQGRTRSKLQLLVKVPAAEVAARTGRGANPVRVKRSMLDIPNPSGPGWTAEEQALLGTAPDAYGGHAEAV